MINELKPAEKAERLLIQAILKKEFAVDSKLPAERQLATTLGVTRPTLREALQRMGRDGWLDIQQGKPTRVRDYLKEGSLGVLQAVILTGEALPDGFVSHVLLVRSLLAPTYAKMAVEQAGDMVVDYLQSIIAIDDTAQAYAEADGGLHKILADCSGNPIFSLIMNGFMPLYPGMGQVYFSFEEARLYSKQFYEAFLKFANESDLDGVEALMTDVMNDAINLWNKNQI